MKNLLPISIVIFAAVVYFVVRPLFTFTSAKSGNVTPPDKTVDAASSIKLVPPLSVNPVYDVPILQPPTPMLKVLATDPVSVVATPAPAQVPIIAKLPPVPVTSGQPPATIPAVVKPPTPVQTVSGLPLQVPRLIYRPITGAVKVV